MANDRFGADFSDVGDAWMRLGCSTSEKRPGTKSRVVMGVRCQQARYGELRLVLELVATQVQPWRALARATPPRMVVERGEKVAERSGLLVRRWDVAWRRPRVIVASGGPAAQILANASARAVLGHEVSMLIGAGVTQCRGAWPRANTSMTRMRPPQHWQARG